MRAKRDGCNPYFLLTMSRYVVSIAAQWNNRSCCLSDISWKGWWISAQSRNRRAHCGDHCCGGDLRPVVEFESDRHRRGSYLLGGRFRVVVVIITRFEIGTLKFARLQMMVRIVWLIGSMEEKVYQAPLGVDEGRSVKRLQLANNLFYVCGIDASINRTDPALPESSRGDSSILPLVIQHDAAS
jgi:hypothetical protein